jgi:hypothetical protein
MVHKEATRDNGKNSFETEKLDTGAPRRPRATARVVLEEMFELLEDYAPTWYTEEHHNRIVEALLDENLH